MTLAEKLDAVEEIKKLKARYFRFVDTKDWAGLAALFTPDARIDLSHAHTPTDAAGRPVAIDGIAPPTPNPDAILDVDRFVETARNTLEGAVSVHHGHMPEIEISGPDSATAIWPMQDLIRWPEGYPARNLNAFGHYHEAYVRTPAGWRISALRLTRLRADVDPPRGMVGPKPAAA